MTTNRVDLLSNDGPFQSPKPCQMPRRLDRAHNLISTSPNSIRGLARSAIAIELDLLPVPANVRSWCVRTREPDIRHLQTSATNSKAVGGVLRWSKLRNLDISFFYHFFSSNHENYNFWYFFSTFKNSTWAKMPQHVRMHQRWGLRWTAAERVIDAPGGELVRLGLGLGSQNPEGIARSAHVCTLWTIVVLWTPPLQHGCTNELWGRYINMLRPGWNRLL